MQISPTGIKLIQHFEGYRDRPYRCPAGLWTIGYGHVMYPEQLRQKIEERKAYPLAAADNRKFTQEEIHAYLVHELVGYERGVQRLCGSMLTQSQFDALVSFAFNVGLGALQRSIIRQKIKRSEWKQAADGFLKYINSGGQVLAGLVRRRQAERALFLSRGTRASPESETETETEDSSSDDLS